MKTGVWTLAAACCLLALASCTRSPVEPLPLACVTDLRIVARSANSITLAWTAPEAQGGDLEYDARYVTSLGGENEITEEIWEGAVRVEGEPVPAAPGTEETLQIVGLLAGRPYWVAIRLVKTSGEMFDLSNTVSAMTYNWAIQFSYPQRPIPNFNPIYPGTDGYLLSSMVCTTHIEAADVEIWVYISHPTRGDLVVTVESPQGTQVVLHDKTGGYENNIYGWYDSEIETHTPGDLDQFYGSPFGTWKLHIWDTWWLPIGSSTGTLMAWGVKVSGDPY